MWQAYHSLDDLWDVSVVQVTSSGSPGQSPVVDGMPALPRFRFRPGELTGRHPVAPWISNLVAPWIAS